MGQENYLLRTGVGIDVDRQGSRQAIGFIERHIDELNRKAITKTAQGMAERNAKYQDGLKDIAESNAQIEKDFKDNRAKAAKDAQDSYEKSLPPEQKAEDIGVKTGVTKTSVAEYERGMRRLGKSYGKFVDKAEKLGIKLDKGKGRGGFGKEGTGASFMKQEAEDRKTLIQLTKDQITENNRIAEQDKTSKNMKGRLRNENEQLEKQLEDMLSLDVKATNAEKKRSKAERENAKKEMDLQKQKAKKDKQDLANMKAKTAMYKKMEKQAKAYWAGAKGAMQNAFIVGTAAAAAFAYKVQPLAEDVLEFERTLINANSVFGESKDMLFEVSDELVKFGLRYGITTEKAAEGLYQLASAGLSAAESQTVLQHTLKLAMATQGDHNTLAKLTVQTIKGFGYEMDMAETLTDKFAHSIQKSLIEWQDLSSSVKFAMPFFVATGQSIDQLLGGLEVLTDRALEAGIAGRGLRQALAQFAKHADNNASAFRKMGIEILDAEGNMKDLSLIAKEASDIFGDVEDHKVLTAMLEDMNVRGATAFALLVQNADEYGERVEALKNTQGEATRMANTQQESLANQIQVVKNALKAPFMLSDPIGKANGTLNEFTLLIKNLVEEFKGFFIYVDGEGNEHATHAAHMIKEVTVEVLQEIFEVVRELKDIFVGTEKDMEGYKDLLLLSTVPLKMMLYLLKAIGPHNLKYLLFLKLGAKLLPITTLLTMYRARAEMQLAAAINASIAAETIKDTQEAKGLAIDAAVLNMTWGKTAAMKAYSWGLIEATGASNALVLSTKALMLSLGLAVMLFAGAVLASGKLSDAFTVMAAVLATVAAMSAISSTFAYFGSAMGPFAIPIALAAGAAMMTGMFKARDYIQERFGLGGRGSKGQAINFDDFKMPEERMYDGGGMFVTPMYDNGGPTTEHGLAMLQKGETIIPKTQNMLDSGITLNISDIHVQDGEDFAERVAEALPAALRRQNDIGGI